MKYLLLCSLVISFIFLACKPKAENTTKNQNSESLTEIQDISLEEAAEKISKGEAIFIDVRTDQEVGDGMIPGSVHIDIKSSTFEEQLAELDKDKEYVVYCRSGGRSARACKKMQSMGFKKLNNMAPGYSQWSKK